MSNGKRKSEAFDTQIARQNGLETGERVYLPRTRYIEVELEDNDSYTLFVRDVKITNGAISVVTNLAKETAGDKKTDTSNIVPARSWVRKKTGQNISTLMQGEDINHRSVEGDDKFIPVDRAERRAFTQRNRHLPPAEQRRLFEERFPNA